MKFMKHDKWSNVLFLHWSIPSDLVPLLQSQCNNFELDQTSDGKYWIGLILLTEQNVGPMVGRRYEKLLVTHHGVNVRTYIKGMKRQRADDNEQQQQQQRQQPLFTLGERGIYFASLECDDFITSYGANYFGMPYRIASMERTFGVVVEDDNGTGTTTNEAATLNNNLIRKKALSSDEIDDWMCGHDGGKMARKYHIKSIRSKRGSNPSICQKISSVLLGNNKNDNDEAAHKTRLELINDKDDTNNTKTGNVEGNNTDIATEGFTVECSWERSSNDKTFTNHEEVNLANFFLERYHVYTHKYGLNWRGTVTHEPWPVESATNVNLKISNLECYEPPEMRPIIQHMAGKEPDSAFFSPGVGPIEFQMLRPV